MIFPLRVAGGAVYGYFRFITEKWALKIFWGGGMVLSQSNLQTTVQGDKTSLELRVKCAGFWLRSLALLVDVIVFGALKFSTEWILIEKLNFLDAMRSVALISPVIVYAVAVLGVMFPFLLIAWFNSSKYQGTPGKILVGIKVTDMSGSRISFWRSLGRHYIFNIFSFLLLFRVFRLEWLLSDLSATMLDLIGIMIGVLCILLPVIGYSMIAFTARKQGLHDKLFGTLVIKR